jgi:hypothetical protein
MRSVVVLLSLVFAAVANAQPLASDEVNKCIPRGPTVGSVYKDLSGMHYEVLRLDNSEPCYGWRSKVLPDDSLQRVVIRRLSHTEAQARGLTQPKPKQVKLLATSVNPENVAATVVGATLAATTGYGFIASNDPTLRCSTADAAVGDFGTQSKPRLDENLAPQPDNAIVTWHRIIRVAGPNQKICGPDAPIAVHILDATEAEAQGALNAN